MFWAALLDLTLTFSSAQMWQRDLSPWATVACNWYRQLLYYRSMQANYSTDPKKHKEMKWNVFVESLIPKRWIPHCFCYRAEKNTSIAPLNTFHCSFSQSTLQGGDNPAAVDGLLGGISVMLHGWVSQQLLEVRYLGWSPLPERCQLYFNSPHSMVHWHLGWTHG